MSQGAKREQQDRSDLEFRLLVTTVVAIVAIFGMAIARFSAADDVVTSTGAVTGLLGTVVGLFFGAKVGGAGKEKAEDERREAQDKVERLAGALPPGDAERLLAR